MRRDITHRPLQYSLPVQVVIIVIIIITIVIVIIIITIIIIDIIIIVALGTLNEHIRVVTMRTASEVYTTRNVC